MRKKVALVTGVNGQDGSYLSELLIEKGYEVHGIIRRASDFNTGRIDHVFAPERRDQVHFGDLAQGLDNLLYSIKPDEVYNIGSMSHVKVSFDIPIYTGDVTGLAVCRLLEAIKMGVKNRTLSRGIRYYQASSSEMFGQTPTPVSGYDENSPFTPVSPYGCAKLYGYHITKTYRTGYGLFASNGILFNHESPRRGPTFVTRKITRAAARIKLRLQDKLELGNLDALRDWGHSKDYVRAIWMIMQAEEPGDYVVATGEQYSVRDFLVKVFEYLDLDYKKYVTFQPEYLRPNEVPNLLGNATKIRTELGWKPEYTIDMLVKEMVDHDFKEEIDKMRKL